MAIQCVTVVFLFRPVIGYKDENDTELGSSCTQLFNNVTL